LEEVGRKTTAASIPEFYDLLRHMTLPSTVNIEGWSAPALKAMLVVCRSSRHSIRLRTASKTMEIVRFSSSTELFDSLAAGILRDEV
jgi:hypothetical protein